MPDQIIREIKLIRRYSRHNEAQDFKFREYIKFKLNMSNAELDAIVWETTDRIWSQIDCTACGHCCRTLHVVVDDKDIARLAKRLGMKPAEFSKRYTKPDQFDGRVFASAPCEFLGEDNRCTVYEDRPKACKDFPYLHETDFRQRTLGVISNCELCPIVFNVWQSLKEQLWRRGRR